jgi:hypothetical protein
MGGWQGGRPGAAAAPPVWSRAQIACDDDDDLPALLERGVWNAQRGAEAAQVQVGMLRTAACIQAAWE